MGFVDEAHVFGLEKLDLAVGIRSLNSHAVSLERSPQGFSR